MEETVSSSATCTLTSDPAASLADITQTLMSLPGGHTVTLQSSEGEHSAVVICTAPAGTGDITESEGVISSGDLTQLSGSALTSQVRIVSGMVPESPGPAGDEDTTGGNTSKWWSRDLTLRLIELYREYQDLFSDSQYKKKSVWELIAKQLANEPELRGKVPYTSTQVSNRWKNLTKMYRDCVDARYTLGGVAAKCQYFEQIASVYSYTPSDAVTAKIPIAVASSGKPTVSRTVRYVPIAPKRPAEVKGVVNSSLTADGTGECSDPKRRKCAHSLQKTGEATLVDVICAVSKLNEDKKKQDKTTMEKLENMQRERMDMFRQFLDILKEYKNS
ncbi:hypothetical protein BaRGS_00036382 [Batillaria attramentaria]|uniref:Myb-like domain-containing protein n=1 Tax=Batillaria attramentaria TaxID=370345 RepID=A0ABD0JC56_9CAEN